MSIDAMVLAKELNKWSKDLGSHVRFRVIKVTGSAIEIFVDDLFIEDKYQVVNLSDHFRDLLNSLLINKYNLDVNFNNTGTIFWSPKVA